MLATEAYHGQNNGFNNYKVLLCSSYYTILKAIVLQGISLDYN